MPTLEWIGKSKVINHHQDVPFRVLERKYSFDENGQHDEDNGSENMIIRGYTLVPLSLYFKHGRVKMEVGLCKGKKLYDKRADAAKRDAKRSIDRAVKSNGKFY